MKLNLKEKSKSIFTKLIMMAFFVIIPLSALMVLINITSEKIVKEQVISSNDMVLLQYMSEVDIKLDNVKLYITGNKFSLSSLSDAFSEDELKAYNAKGEIKSQLKFAQNLYKYVDGFFIYSDSDDFLSFQNPRTNTYNESLAKKCIKTYVSEYPKEKNPYDDGWNLLYDDFEYLLVFMIRQGDYYIGAWILEDSLISRIKKLKIGIYEEKLSKQQTEQQFLKLQIKPHFFLNALNTVLSLMYTKQYNVAEELMLCIANHFRYILYTSDTIDLIDEIEQTKNYLAIQEKRYEKCFKYEIYSDEELYGVQVPTLSIQTFVENSIKYVDFEKVETHITLIVKKDVFEDKKYMVIEIDDNGDGFDDDVLRILNSGEKLKVSGQEHIGIYNVKKRLGYIYGDKATLQLSNNDKHGAHVEMHIPYEE